MRTPLLSHIGDHDPKDHKADAKSASPKSQPQAGGPQSRQQLIDSIKAKYGAKPSR